MVVHISNISRNLTLLDNGIWAARNQHKVSYPEDGSARCFDIEDYSFWFRHRNQVILEAVTLFPPGGPLFDIGGGNGVVSLFLKQNGHETVLVEPGLEGVCNARRRGLSHVIHSTLEDAGFEHESLPAAGLFDVLEHIENDVEFLRSIRTLLHRRQGRLYLTVPAYSFLWSSEDVYAQHRRRYSLKSLTNTLASSGYNIEYSTYFFAAMPVPIFLVRSLPSRLPWRKKHVREQPEKGHGAGQGYFRHLVRWYLDKELSTIHKKRTIPFGASCLVVARPGSVIDGTGQRPGP